jgi:hypothetical protein
MKPTDLESTNNADFVMIVNADFDLIVNADLELHVYLPVFKQSRHEGNLQGDSTYKGMMITLEPRQPFLHVTMCSKLQNTKTVP